MDWNDSGIGLRQFSFFFLILTPKENLTCNEKHKKNNSTVSLNYVLFVLTEENNNYG